MALSKKFLIPVSAALAALTGSADAAVSTNNYKNETSTSNTTQAVNNKLGMVLAAGDRLATVQRGNEFHDLILRKNENGVVVAGHYSHSSHASHSSHSSHYSSR